MHRTVLNKSTIKSQDRPWKWGEKYILVRLMAILSCFLKLGAPYFHILSCYLKQGASAFSMLHGDHGVLQTMSLSLVVEGRSRDMIKVTRKSTIKNGLSLRRHLTVIPLSEPGKMSLTYVLMCSSLFLPWRLSTFIIFVHYPQVIGSLKASASAVIARNLLVKTAKNIYIYIA